MGIVLTSVRGLKRQARDTEVTEVTTAGKRCHSLGWQQKMLRVSEPRLLKEEPQELGVRLVRGCCLLLVALLFMSKEARDWSQCCWEGTGPLWEDIKRKMSKQEGANVFSPLPVLWGPSGKGDE